jgi:uncharacterized membrane protein YfcA
MDLLQGLLLVGVGLAAGFVGALVGVGGGVLFAPVLFFYFQSLGVDPGVLAPLTIGTSLFCTFIVGCSSAWFHHRRQAVQPRVAFNVGLLSAVAVFLMTRYVTTQPWYDGRVFQGVFSIILLVVVARMLLGRRREAGPPVEAKAEAAPAGMRWPVLAGIGSVAGVVSSAAGVGGGVVLVPFYHNLLRLSMPVAVGTSSATIVLISLVGVLNYAAMGLGADVPATALGYVDVGHALVLAVPAVFGAPLGVWVAHRVDTRTLRWSFAALAAFVAVRLLLRAL